MLAAIGAVVRLYASGFIVKNRELATDGPYSLVRHPLYTGNLLLLVGFTVASGQWWAALVSAWFWWFYYPTAIEYEDRKLRRIFGERCAEWQQATPAVLPRGLVPKRGGTWSLLHEPQPQRRAARAGVLALLARSGSTVSSEGVAPMTGPPGDRSPPAPASSTKLLGRGYQGAVYLVDGPDGPVIVKKAIGRGLARAIRRAMLRREHSIYQLLRGIPGVPRCHGLRDGEELVLEFIDGQSLRAGQAPARRARAVLRRIARADPGPFTAPASLTVTSSARTTFCLGATAARSSSTSARPYRRRRALASCAAFCSGNCAASISTPGSSSSISSQRVEMAPADRQYFDPTAPERVARVIRRAWRAVTLRRLRRSRRARPD